MAVKAQKPEIVPSNGGKIKEEYIRIIF